MESQSHPFIPATEDHSEANAPSFVSGSSPTKPARPALPIIALSEDALLLEAVTNAAVDCCPVITSPSADRFIDQLVATGAELILIDAAAAPSDLADFLRTLSRQFPQLQMLVAGPGNVQHLIASQIADGTVFRFAHKPASAQRLKLFVDAALRQRQTRITEEILGMPVPATLSVADGARAPERARSSSGFPLWMKAALATLVLVVISGVIAWSVRSTQSKAPAAASAIEPVKQAAPPIGSVPGPVNAVAAQRAAEQEAIDRAAAERSERSERDRLAAEAEARAHAVSADQSRRATEARASQIHQYVQLAQQRIANGALIEPADDSARSYVAAAIEAAPDDQEVRAVSMALGEALIASFRKALAAHEYAVAAHWLQACRDYQVAESTVNQMRVQLAGYEVEQTALAAATHAMAGIAFEPASATPADIASAAAPTPAAVTAPSASQPVTATSGILPESALHRQHFVAPVYPPVAVAKGRTGTVELDFTVTPKGKVADIEVTSSDPPGVFDRATITALSRSEYQPVERDGVPVAQRAHIRMRFAL